MEQLPLYMPQQARQRPPSGIERNMLGVGATNTTLPATAAHSYPNSPLIGMEEELRDWTGGRYHGQFARQVTRKAQRGKRDAWVVLLAYDALDPTKGHLIFEGELGRGNFGKATKARCRERGKLYVVKEAREVKTNIRRALRNVFLFCTVGVAGLCSHIKHPAVYFFLSSHIGRISDFVEHQIDNVGMSSFRSSLSV